MGAILYKGKVYGAGGSIIEGYYKVADGKFYEESTYETEIAGAEDLLYIDLTSKMQFIFDGTNFVNITDNVKPTVEEATGTRTNIASGDTLKTIIGKIKKFFADLKTVAFTGAYSDLTGTPTIPTITDTYSGTSSDGMSGKAVKEGLDTLITETDTTNTKPYLYRSTQTTGDRLYDKLVGCSFAVNQLVQNGDFASTSGWTVNSSKVSGFSVSSNVASMSISSGNGSYDGILYTANYIPYVQGHKYLVMADFKSTLANTICTVYAGTNAYNILSNSVSRITLSAINTWYKLTKIVTASNSSDGTTNSRTRIGIISTSFSSAITLNVKNVNVIDLTQLFGTSIANEAYTKEQASAGSGIEWLKSYGFFSKDYYAYNAGAIASVMPTAHKMVGKNLLPMTLDKIKAANTSGTWSGNSYTYNGVVWTLNIGLNNAVIGISAKGTATTANGSLFVVYDWSTTLLDNNTSYTLNGCPSGGSQSTYYLTVNNSSAVSGGNDYAIDSGSGVTFTTKASRYTVCRIVVKKDVVVNDITFTPMLRLSDVNDATFEPYTEYTYPLTTELRGIPTLVDGEIVYDGDINEGDGATQRKYGIVDLGTLTWSYSNSIFYSITGLPAKQYDARATQHIVSGLYPAYSWTDFQNVTYGMAFQNASATLRIKDAKYTDAATFKTAMSGVYLVYELATPTSDPSTPFANPQICDKNGTEEYIDSRDMPIPVGHNTKYVDIPDWMEEGYYKDFRDRADSIEVGKVSTLAIAKGNSYGQSVTLKNTMDYTYIKFILGKHMTTYYCVDEVTMPTYIINASYSSNNKIFLRSKEDTNTYATVAFSSATQCTVTLFNADYDERVSIFGIK